jgi:NADH-quinone oxidoreductase subunit N
MLSINPSDLWTIAPQLIIGGGALLLLLLDVFFTMRWSRAVVALVVQLASIPYLVWQFQEGGQALSGGFGTAFGGMLFSDSYTTVVNFFIVVSAALATLVSASKLSGLGVKQEGEYYTLLLFATLGAIIFVSAAELITLFLGLELMSMALYCLCGSARTERRAIESALKYFLLGSFSSAFLLFGMALMYGLTGTTFVSELGDKLLLADTAMVSLAFGMSAVGLLFKMGVVPFHFWTPDVYEGAPTSVTLFMSTTIKTAAVAVALRFTWLIFGGMFEDWSKFIWLASVLTMVIANVIALRQRNLKRMLAYSSIGHAGYMLMAFLAPGEYAGATAILFYLVVYTVMTVGAFSVLLALDDSQSPDIQKEDIRRLNGFGYRHPVLAALMSLFMLSMAGIPPGMAGLLGKFYLFSSVVSADFVGLALIGVLSAAIGCYYYLRVIIAMYFVADEGDGATVTLDPALAVSLMVTGAGVLLLGIFPNGLYQVLDSVTKSF